MNKQLSRLSGIRRQEGAVLVVCLVILLVMTILGVSNMESTSTQLKMASNNQSRQIAFQAAETALAKVERGLQLNGYNVEEFQSCAANTSTCYDQNCAGGKCFIGSYATGDEIIDCSLSPVIDPGNYWSRSDLDVWNNPARHQTVNLESINNIPDPKYIVEFLCYVDKDDVAATSCVDNPSTDCAVLYRITTLATSEDQKGRVMLQSTFKVASS